MEITAAPDLERGHRPQLRELQVSVVVCTYTELRWRMLLEALDSLRVQSRAPHEVILVVDHNERLVELARSSLPRGIEVVENAESPGLAGARNTGAKFAVGEIVAFLDDDAVADPHWLACLTAHYDDEEVVGTGGAIVAVWPHGARPGWFPPEFDWVVGCSYRGMPDSLAPVRNPLGASMSIRKSVIEDLGGFDTAMGRLGSIPLGCEETELAVRVRGRFEWAQFLHVPDSIVRHRVTAQRTRLTYFVQRCYAEGVSKAALSRRTGARRGLSSERRYAMATLPRGVVGGLGRALRGDIYGLIRAATILLGFLTTALGFAFGMVGRRSDRPSRLSTGRSAAAARERKHLLGTFGYLVAQQGSTAVLGLIFWIFVTHFFAPNQVGVAFAASYSGLLLSALGVLGVPTLLIAQFREVEEGQRRPVLSTAMATAGVSVGILAVVIMAFSGHFGKNLSIIGSHPDIAAFFVLGAAGTALAAAFDSAAIAVRRGQAQVARGSLASLLRFGFVGILIAVGARTTSGLVLSWAAGLGASLFLCYGMLRLPPAAPGSGSPSGRVAVVRRYGRLSLNHHVLTLSFNSVGYLVPVVAAILAAAPQYAYFATANTVASAILVVPWLLALSLFAETSSDEALLHRHIRHTLPLGTAVCTTIVVAVEFASPTILQVFGGGYASHGAVALRLLVLLGPSYVIKDHYVSVRRARGQMSSTSKVMILGTVAEGAGAAIGGALNGVSTLCVGWVLAAFVEALVLLPTVMRVYRGKDAGATYPMDPQRVPGALAVGSSTGDLT